MTAHDIERLIAIEFFGWEETKKQFYFVQTNGNTIDVRNTFTKDITFAWTIAEKMKKVWPDFAVTSEGDNWNVFWGFNGIAWHDVTARSVEVALCLACLKSKDIDITIEPSTDRLFIAQ